ncbi:uroporphyrinogen-III C-methyltransferase [Polynucleobacter sp. MWH-Spelu-300-X4]|uniref:uroporphyrinogen-III C-methyltransferase n=1 Tax=Polynucleobacter sp. MWH-Spelu-300-X4 TaxID=2689109 RepID=UPI001BFE5153|nr:uroporphyrinogen-III C-methyltransferase [Polynucleobacter sp. MWH-Spelu-300-X4]QWD80187.1 uroporphyrinogen-III C-methyltransferase [Polynucleobacter sp. MWH-Spelu-300-X4]
MENNNQQNNKPKTVKSDALTQGLWKALWIALAVCILWLGIEGGFRLYHRPAKLDARVAELEAQLAVITAHESELDQVLKGSLEAERALAPTAGKIAELINRLPPLPMNALPTPASQASVSTTPATSLSQKVLKEIQGMGDRLVRIQVVGDVKDVALTPAAQDLVRQQLRLHLVSARMAWLSRMPNVCKEDLVQAEQLLSKHYQAQAPAVVAMQKALADLKADMANQQSQKGK